MQFHELEELQRSVRILKQYHEVSLTHYHLPKSCGFNRLFNFDKSKVDCSKASTSTCVLSLTKAGYWSSKQPVWYDKTEMLVDELVRGEWTSAKLKENNPFTTSFLLECILELQSIKPDMATKKEIKDKVTFAISVLNNSLSRDDDGFVKGAAKIDDYPPSTFLTQLVIRVLLRSGPLGVKIRRSVQDWSWTQIEHELALIYSKSKSADAFALAYAVLLFVSCTKSFEASPDQSHILSKAIDCIFELQLPDGSWPRSRPLFHYPSVGNAYCFEYEMLTQFLQEKELIEHSLKHLPELALATKRLKDTAFEFEEGGYGWASGHHPQIAGPESWSTASVYHFLHVLDRVLAEAIRREVFDYVGIEYLPTIEHRTSSHTFCENLWDSKIKVSDGIELSLKETLYNKFVQPIYLHSKDIDNGCDLPRTVPISAVFYGPPGTSKTQLAKEISVFLKWPLLSIDPSNLVREGFEKVQAETNSLFTMLSKLERCVVLLDEFDEMLRERTDSQSETLSRFLTTTMLPKLSQINESRRIVFIVATNHIEQFDFAIKRPGRFDLIVQIMPPTTEAKLAARPTIQQKLQKEYRFRIDTLRPNLEPLTFSEFSELERSLLKANNREHATQIMKDAKDRCTLMQPLKSGETSTWIDECEKQIRYIRIPDSY
jgi:hypothetical protein